MAKEVKKLSEEVVKKAGGEKNLRRIELPIDDNGQDVLEIIVKVPDRRTLGQYLKYQQVNPAKAQDILVKACVLTDLDQVLQDDGLFLSAFGQLAELIPIREGRIKKY